VSNSLRWQRFKQSLSSLLVARGHSRSSALPIPIRLESQLPKEPLKEALKEQEDEFQSLLESCYQGSLSSPRKDNLFWCSFRDHDGDFLGVVIARGTSPGNAASKAIDKLELPTNRGSIVMIPVSREGEFEQYQDRLLDEKSAIELMKSLDIQAIIS
jgi:hypothetical protein